MHSLSILDVTAGNRHVWFNKRHEMAIYCDIRPEVSPDVLLDGKSLPFADDSFRLVVFDPPHVNVGKNSKLTKLYGHHTTKQIREMIVRLGVEINRVLVSDGLCAFKWNDHDIRLSTILELMPMLEPLFGHQVSIRTRRTSSTYWVMLRNVKKRVPLPELEQQSPVPREARNAQDSHTFS